MSSDQTPQQQRQRTLLDAGVAMASERRLDVLLHRIVEVAVDVLDAEYGALGVIDPTGTGLSAFHYVGVDDATRKRIGALPEGRGVLGTLIDDPRPLRLTRIDEHPDSVGFPDGHPPMITFLGVPLTARGSVKGRLYLANKRGGAFTADDEATAIALAAQAAVAIHNAELNEALDGTVRELNRRWRELEVANDELARANRAKTDFLSNVSHELRSPLNTILGYARLLDEEADELTDEHREDLAAIRNSGEDLLRLVNELLDLGRIEAGRIDLELSPVDVHALVEETLVAVRPLVNAGVELRADVQAGLTVMADRARLRQVLLNLAGNAAKFTTGGEIIVHGQVDDGDVLLSVSDTGAGIPKDDLGRLFESFFQSSAALARTPDAAEGAGLGLAISQKLIERHGGTITAESELGAGTTISVRLPLDPADLPSGGGA